MSVGRRKKTLDWVKRETELISLLEKYRSKTNDFDCVVPVSGGKDGLKWTPSQGQFFS